MAAAWIHSLAQEILCAVSVPIKKKKKNVSVAVTAQQLTKPTSIHEDLGPIPDLA